MKRHLSLTGLLTLVAACSHEGSSPSARMCHENNADTLATGQLKGAYFIGDSEEAVYETDLETSLNAAERTAMALDWLVTGKELNDVWAQLDARSADSNPARFRIMHVDDRARRTKVTFIAGNSTTDTSKTMTARMREEFDRQIAAHAR